MDKETVDEESVEETQANDSTAMQDWFWLSDAAWLTLPRVLVEAMSLEWQDKMAALLNEYDSVFPNRPDLGTIVVVTEYGHMIETPEWLDYRHPDLEAIDKCRTERDYAALRPN